MGHGGGGAMSGELVEHVFLPSFGDASLAAARRLRGARAVAGGRMAFSTDSFVVRPLFFPGGCIGDLAVNGTVNDLAMSGAQRAVPVGGVHPRGGHRRHPGGRGRAAAWATRPTRAGVRVVTGDTKVVESGHGDGVYVNTAGIGVVPDGRRHPAGRVPSRGDVVIVSGDIGVHGVAVMSVREGLEFGTEVLSDCAPLDGLVAAMLAVTPDLHVLRDPTRGGRGDLAQRDRQGLRGRHQRSTSGACRSPRWSPTPARSSAWTRCRWPTRASCWRSCRATQADEVLAAMRAHPLGARRRDHRRVRRGPPGHGVGADRLRGLPGRRPADRRAAARGSADMKFLVLWQLEQALLSDAMVRAIARMPEYGARLEREGKVLMRYHVVGAHGGAWIYDVDSHEEFERLLATAPVFNFARYTLHPLADMTGAGR